MIPSKAWIKLNRNILKWECFKDPNVCHLWIYILLSANAFPNEWKGTKIKAGQFITSREHLSEETGLTVSQVRTALKILTERESIRIDTVKGKGGYTIITVLNYEQYQVNETKQKKRGYI